MLVEFCFDLMSIVVGIAAICSAAIELVDRCR